MKIGLIDVDGHNFPNLPLMNISAWHKKQGDHVEWYNPLFSGHVHKVYMSKIFTFTDDYPYYIDADEIVKGGTGYYYPDGGKKLPHEIEHIYPDYSLYPKLTKDTAYGFLTRGCPRDCDFCIVGKKEGKCSIKVAYLSEFWNGQKNIELCDPNMFACKDWKDLSQQLIDSRAWIDFNQGCDIRIMNDEKLIIPKFEAFKEITGWDKRKLPVYVLCNFNTTHEQDLERIYTLRELGFWPYVMIYEKDKLPKGHITRRMQRWVNMRAVFEQTPRFEDYMG